MFVSNDDAISMEGRSANGACGPAAKGEHSAHVQDRYSKPLYPYNIVEEKDDGTSIVHIRRSRIGDIISASLRCEKDFRRRTHIIDQEGVPLIIINNSGGRGLTLTTDYDIDFDAFED